MTATPFITVDEIKEHVTPEVYGTALGDAAMQRLLDMCEADVLMHAGNHLGVVFSSSILDIRFQCHSSSEWLRSFATVVGNPTFAGTGVMINSISWEVPTGGAGRITVAGRAVPGTTLGGSLSSIFVASTTGDQKTMYLIYGQDLIPIEFSLIDESAGNENQVIFEFPSGESYYTDLAMTFNGIDAGEAIDLSIASAGSFIPYNAGGQKAFRQNAIIELMKLRLAFNGLTNYSDAGYSQTVSNLKEERARILEELSQLKRQPHDALSM